MQKVLFLHLNELWFFGEMKSYKNVKAEKTSVCFPQILIFLDNNELLIFQSNLMNIQQIKCSLQTFFN